ncbi:MAG: hypothetical protein JXA09_00810 [Anaerolineae bacterium]|nr:hypothetical protein [Anaerolineae bacterium]
MLESLLSQIREAPGGWIVLVIGAAVLLFAALRLARRAISATLRLVILLGAIAVIAIAILAFRAMLGGGGLPLP